MSKRTAWMIVLVAGGAVIAPIGCGKSSPPSSSQSSGSSSQNAPTPTPSSPVPVVQWDLAFVGTPVEIRDRGDGVIVRVHFAGDTAAPAARAGDTVIVEFIARYAQKDEAAVEFSSSAKRGGPLRVPLTDGSAVPGLLRGLEGLRAGDVARIEIPAPMGYGETGRAPVPGNAALEFDVRVVDVESGGAATP